MQNDDVVLDSELVDSELVDDETRLDDKERPSSEADASTAQVSTASWLASPTWSSENRASVQQEEAADDEHEYERLFSDEQWSTSETLLSPAYAKCSSSLTCDQRDTFGSLKYICFCCAR
jgi:hypothetical protein